MKKYIPVLLSFIFIIITTTTLVSTDYVKTNFNIVIPGLMQFAQWMLIYFNVAEFGYTIARADHPKRTVISIVIVALLTVAFAHAYYGYIRTM